MKTYLTLPTSERQDGLDISHEIWMLARPKKYSESETSQYYCGVLKHPDEPEIAVGPISGYINVHSEADPEPLVELLTPYMTNGDILAMTNAINVAKGGKLNLVDLFRGIPGLSDGLVSKDYLTANDWFQTDDLSA